MPPGEGIPESAGSPAFASNENEVLVAHQLCHRRGHLRRDAIAPSACESLRCRRRSDSEPVTKIADAQPRDWCEGAGVVGIDNQPHDFVVFVGDQRFLEELGKRDFGERQLRCDPLLVAGGSDTGKCVAGTGRGRLRHQFAQVAELMRRNANPLPVVHDRYRVTASRPDGPSAEYGLDYEAMTGAGDSA